MPSIRRTPPPPLRLSTMSSTVLTILGITQVPEAPNSSIPLSLAHHPLQSPGHLLLPPVPNSTSSSSSRASPSSNPQALAHTTSTSPSHPSTQHRRPAPALPLLTRTPSNPPLLTPIPTLSAPHPRPLPHLPSKHFMPLPSSTSNNLEKKPLPKSSISLKPSLTSSFPHSPRTVGPSTNLLTAWLVTSHLRTSPSRTSHHPLLKHLSPPLLPPLHCHPLLDLSPYSILRSTSPPLSTSLLPRLASLPTVTLTSTPSTMSRTIISGSHPKSLSTAGSSTTFPGPKALIPLHLRTLSPHSMPMPTTPSTSTPTARSPQSTSVPK